jgi:DNA-binding transcriptional LysR family regulator
MRPARDGLALLASSSVVVRSSQIDIIVEFVASGLGAAFLPRMIAAECTHPHARHVSLSDPTTEWHIALICRGAIIYPMRQRLG